MECPSGLVSQTNCMAFFESFLSVFRWMILYVYIPLLESELEDLKLAYNAHKIRTQKGKLRPDGIPDDMYYFQERFGKAFFILILIP